LPPPPDVIWTTVFPDGDGGGNPCPLVLPADAWSPEEMQQAAATFGHESAFVLRPRAGGHVRLRYFVPRHEMEMCVHATIAAVVLLARRGRLPANPAGVETPLGIRHVGWNAAAGTATVEQFPPEFAEPVADLAEVVAALGSDDITGPVQAVSTARPKLMVPVRDEHVLDALRPDFPRLWEACDALDVTGFYPFALPAEGADAAARQFPRRAGYDEDPATGVAACALGAYLTQQAAPGAGWQRYRIAQGRALGRPSLITAEAHVDDNGRITATRVGGRMDVRPAPR
jgi:trans-2,3-dihydro-3-hydroxyanthranilate isomerase